MSAWKVVESDILSRHEVEMVWGKLCRRSARSMNTRQTRVVFCLATFCGLRNSDICGLRLRDARAPFSGAAAGSRAGAGC